MMSEPHVESFADLLNEQIKMNKIYPGSIIPGTVVAIDSEMVVVNAGLKSEAYIPIPQFLSANGEVEVAIGDVVDVAVESLEDGTGATVLSREKAKRAESWTFLLRAQSANETVRGVITGKVKGGFTVEIDGVRAFLPGSLIDVRPVREVNYLEGKELDFKVIKLDKKRNNVVVSRRIASEAEGSSDRQSLLGNLQEGQEIVGVVKNLTDYGAFVDLGGIDGLLHITDMSWRRIKHPSEVVSVGKEIAVKVLKFDRDRNRVSLGIKQLGADPWVDIGHRYPQGLRLRGKVTNITDYGCFVEIEDGIEGLVHVSEMDWTNKNIHPSKVVQLSDEVEVMVLEVDSERRRISLGVKQCVKNPWEVFAETHGKNEKIEGKIKSLTDFGVFVGLEGGIDGLVHLSDISWHVPGEEAIRSYKKGDEISAMILSIDAERERISLGIKQLESDPMTQFAADNAKGTLVKGIVGLVDAKGAVVDLGGGVDGYLRASELAQENVEDARNGLSTGQEIEAVVMGVDRKNRVVNLSMRAKWAGEGVKAADSLNRANVAGGTLGDLLKEQINTSNTRDEENAD